MRENFLLCLAHTLIHEGGWSDHPADPGGATIKGVTLKTFSAFKGRPCTKTQLRAISDADLQAIYKSAYWDKIKADALPAGVDAIAFDVAVNSGPSRALKWLEVTKTLDPLERVTAICKKRRAFWQGLTTFSSFGKGWMRRGAAVEAFALKLAGGKRAVEAALAAASKAKTRARATATLTALPLTAPVLLLEQAKNLPPTLLFILIALILAASAAFLLRARMNSIRQTALKEVHHV